MTDILCFFFECDFGISKEQLLLFRSGVFLFFLWPRCTITSDYEHMACSETD